MFIPTTQEEMRKLGWGRPDVVIVSGDTYIDAPSDGAAAIGKYLAAHGFRVGIIAQPDLSDSRDITRLGSPRLFWGVTAGCVDSMVANYTALRKRKHKDDLTPGGENNRRPDRAVIAYANAIRKYFKSPAPIILGGIEASLRRIAHYDYWSDSVRRPVIFDAKADGLVYGMGEKTILEIANKIKNDEDWRSTRGLCFISREMPENAIALPSFGAVTENKEAFLDMFNAFYKYSEPFYSQTLTQEVGGRYLVQNPPQLPPSEEELDSYYALGYEREPHPFYAAQGEIKACETIRHSITSHRGCYGECSFCSIAVHQGRRIVSRSEKSIIEEAKGITALPGFKGYISDVGGATANMYASRCRVNTQKPLCPNKRCTYPAVCPSLELGHSQQLSLLRKIRSLDGVKKVFIGSGIRFDLIVADKANGNRYLSEIVENHISGQMKIAPEHTSETVLHAMRKNSRYLSDFIRQFKMLNRQSGKRQFLTYYLMAAHPGTGIKEMAELAAFLRSEIGSCPEQVQIFTPTPSTFATAMYYTGLDPETRRPIFVEKDLQKKSKQKAMLGR